MTTVFDPVVILFREISCQSLFGVLRLVQLCCMKNWYYYRYLAVFKISNMTIVRKTKFAYLYNQTTKQRTAKNSKGQRHQGVKLL